MDKKQMEENKERYLSILKYTPILNSYCGTNELIHCLEESDFFIAPASINYHGNYDGGLCEHCLQVYDNIMKLSKVFECNYSEKELTLVSLLHDICKVGIYKKEFKTRKKKDENGNFLYNEKGKNIWEDYQTWIIDDKLPLGHGEKSVMILMRFYQLTDNEIMAIRWHMGGYDDITKSYIGNLTANNAFNSYPIITLLHIADLSSIFIQLKKEEIKPDLNFISFETDEDLQRSNF